MKFEKSKLVQKLRDRAQCENTDSGCSLNWPRPSSAFLDAADRINSLSEGDEHGLREVVAQLRRKSVFYRACVAIGADDAKDIAKGYFQAAQLIEQNWL